MQSPKRNKQKGNGSNSQQHENSLQHDESSSAQHRLHPGEKLSSKAEPRAQIEGSARLARALIDLYARRATVFRLKLVGRASS